MKQMVKKARRFFFSPRVGRQLIVRQLRNLGVRPGGILLVHSSLSALGYVVGGVNAVIAALRDVIDPTGTLVMPSHTWESMDSGCRTFDVRLTPGCVGAIPELFRSLPGVKRSLHPTHSVSAVGPDAAWLIDDHERAPTPCGEGTPYAKLLDRNGQILFLGCGLESNTEFHTIEALTNSSYLMRDETEQFNIIDDVGRRQVLPFRRHMSGIPRCFPLVESMLLRHRVATIGRLGQARLLLIDGSGFRKLMVSALTAQPGLLLANADLSVCSERIGAVASALQSCN